MTRAAALRPARPLTVLLAVLAALGLVVSQPAGGDPEGPGTTLAATTVPPTTLPPTTVPAPTRPPTTLPPVTTVPPEPVVQPDLAVRRAPDGPWLGMGRLVTRIPVTLDTPARDGQRVTFVFRLRHDGSAAAAITLSGQGDDPNAVVRWLLGGRDVTRAVARGTLRLVVDPGGHRDVTLSVTLDREGRDGFELGRTLTATATDGGARDRVRAVVSRGPAPVRFHDVGPALGLPRRSHSFDIDAARIDGDDIEDLVLSTHGRVDVLINHRPGLENVQTWSGGDIHACAVGDADGDDLPDVYCTVGAENGNGAKRNRLWLQRPDGSFTTNVSEEHGLNDTYGRGRHTTFVDLDHQRGIDLFVGNENPRFDENRSINRTYLSTGSPAFLDARLGMRADVGGLCAQAADQDRNGWTDLLVCGGAGPATVGWHPDANQLHLFRNLGDPDGGRRLVDVAPRLGIDLQGVMDARLAHLDGDNRLDLVVVTLHAVTVWPGQRNGAFGLPVFREALRVGHAVAVADVDGRLGLDLYVVQGCGGPSQVNLDDRLYLDIGPGWRWDDARLPAGIAGCGDTAEALDVDGDGVDDLVVGNGRWSALGPIQVLTSGRYWG